MTALETSFEKLLGRTPTQAERDGLYRARDALGIKENDALWLVLMALESYRGQYADVPRQIGEMTRQTLNDLRQSTYELAEFSVQMTKADLAQTLSDTTIAIASTTSIKQKWKWISIGIFLSAAALCIVGWLSYSAGRDAGQGLGYQAAQDEIAAANWANTPEGQRAFHMAHTGDLALITGCLGKGWMVDKGNCYPTAPPHEGVYGWRLP